MPSALFVCFCYYFVFRFVWLQVGHWDVGFAMLGDGLRTRIQVCMAVLIFRCRRRSVCRRERLRRTTACQRPLIGTSRCQMLAGGEGIGKGGGHGKPFHYFRVTSHHWVALCCMSLAQVPSKPSVRCGNSASIPMYIGGDSTDSIINILLSGWL